MEDRTETHLKSSRRILRYLLQTCNLSLLWWRKIFIGHIPGDENSAAILTKAVDAPSHQRCLQNLNLLST
jgi:hypothetical protein